MKIQFPKYYQDVTVKEASAYYTSHTDVEKLAAFGNDTEVVLKMSSKAVHDIVVHLDNLMDTEEGAALPTGKFTHGGKLYGLYPDFHLLEYGAYLDIMNYCESDYTYWQNATKCCSVLFREVTIDAGDNYEVVEYSLNDKVFEDLPVIYLNSAAFFLSNLGLLLESNTNSYILTMVKKELAKARAFLTNGGRTTLFTTWLTRTFCRWKR
jgi:hypothetical protein